MELFVVHVFQILRGSMYKEKLEPSISRNIPFNLSITYKCYL